MFCVINQRGTAGRRRGLIPYDYYTVWYLLFRRILGNDDNHDYNDYFQVASDDFVD